MTDLTPAGIGLQSVPVSTLRPAAYNPREIAPDTLQRLQSSIELLGFAKPVICMPDGLLLAGHQRTKAAKAAGWDTVPGFVLPGVTEGDQIRFNQLHNGTDIDTISEPVFVPPSDTVREFKVLPASAVRGNARSSYAPIRGMICGLIRRYGTWGSCIATASGRVIACSHYALSCKILGQPVLVYYVPDESGADAASYLTARYGEFSYDHLPRNTYHQTYAQPPRLRSDLRDTGCQGRSVLYTEHLLPRISKATRVLDFGCGFGDWCNALKKNGHAIWGVEFFRRQGQSPNIDTAAVHKMVDEMLAEYRARGPFDVVIADSVLNSIDSIQAERDVLVCLNAFCKRGGLVIFSGRRRLKKEHKTSMTSSFRASGSVAREFEFFDREGVSGIFRNGAWFFQKFHKREQVLAMVEFFPGSRLQYCEKKEYWFAELTRDGFVPMAGALESVGREFDLMWPGGQSVGRREAAQDALRSVSVDFAEDFR